MLKVKIIRQYNIEDERMTREIMAEDFELKICSFLESIKDKKIHNIFHFHVGNIGWGISVIYYEDGLDA